MDWMFSTLIVISSDFCQDLSPHDNFDTNEKLQLASKE